MLKVPFVALLAISAASVQAQPARPSIQASPDSAEQRQALREVVTCLAEQRPRWARQTLAHPYLSDAQATEAAEVLTGTDTCIPDASNLTFRTSSLVGALAEHFVRAEINPTNYGRVRVALNSLTPLNVSEDFALCVAAHNPAAARDLVLSELGGTAEMQAARQLGGAVSNCHNPGENLTVDVQSLRALVSTALYRGLRRTVASN